MLRDRKMFLTTYCNACHPSQSHHFSSFCSFDGFQLARSANGIHIPSWPCTQNTVKTFQGSLHCSFWLGKRQRKGAEEEKNLKNTVLQNHRNVDLHRTYIITGPTCLAKCGGGIFNLRTWPIHTGLRSQLSAAIITITRGPWVILILYE